MTLDDVIPGARGLRRGPSGDRTPARRVVAVLLCGLILCQLPLDIVAVARADDDDLDRGALEQGLEVALAIRNEIGFIDDEEQLKRVYDLGTRIAYAARDDETVYTFYLVDMPEPNAFAVPGGYIFITQGMLDLELDDDALAHLLGHEVAHVRNRHASRLGIWATITSILQTAVMITVAAAASSASPVTYEDEYGREHTRVGGASDAIAGASVMSTVFREFFLRGYSRGLETEADEEGARLATSAGFPSDGGVDMLESLHARVYEGGGYTYWRTHPFFDDRVLAARSRLWRPSGVPDSVDVARFRDRSQERLAKMARRVDHEEASLLLYRNALRWGTEGVGDVDVQLELVRFRVERADKRKPLARRLGPLIAELDDVEAELANPDTFIDAADREAWLVEARVLRATIEAQLGQMLPGYLALMDTKGAASNEHLHGFIENFPDHPRAAEAQLSLARRYMRTDQPELAVPELRALFENEATPDSILATGFEELARCTAAVEDLSACYEIVHAAPDSTIGEMARIRMDMLALELDDLESAGRFLKRWGDTPYSDQVRERVEELAWSEERFGRVFEAGGKPQRALDIYNRVVLLAPETEAAVDALRGIERIHRLDDS